MFKPDQEKQEHKSRIVDAAPSPPQEFHSQVTGTSVSISWQTSESVKKYNLYMASDPGVTPLTVTFLKDGQAHKDVSSPFNITGLGEGVSYYFVVTAENKFGESEPSIEISATTVAETTVAETTPAQQPLSTLQPPANVQTVAGNEQVMLSWDPVPEATQYNLYMATEYGINPKLYSQLHDGMAHLNVSSPYTIYGLKNNVIHYFVVAAVNDTGEGPISQEVFATPQSPIKPQAPLNFTVEAGDTQVTLSWTETAEIDRYHVYVATEPGISATSYSRLPGSLTIRNIRSPYVFRGLANGVRYYFVLTGETETGGEGEASVEQSATPHPPVIPPPANVQTLVSDKQLTITWQPSQGAESYNVYMASQSGVAPGSITSLTNGVVFTGAKSPLLISNLQNNITYYLVVTATNQNRESAPSPEISATPQKPYIPPPPRSKKSIDNYITLDEGGKPLPIQATPYLEQPWPCAKSVKTGLIWEAKTNDGGIRDRDNTYSWYNLDSRSNGGIPGVANGGQCVGSDCDINDYVIAINDIQVCGYNDWRVPSREELLTLIDTDVVYPQPTIDAEAFPNTQSSYFWTLSVYNFNPKLAWFVYFGSGYDYYEDKSFASHIRLVRGKKKQ